MPILERDPWRDQYFEGIPCPADVLIPTDDGDAYQFFSEHRWVYNKLLICETQGIAHGPHGVAPGDFPVFSKPIYNLRGMGIASRTLCSLEEYHRAQTPGHMWMTLLEGEHMSTDAAVLDGRPMWWRHAIGKALEGGTFDYWTVLAEARPAIESYCGDWIARHLRGYTGIVNFETIGGRIIEVHLRLSDQWPDLYGRGWVESVIELYARRHWSFADDERRVGYSVVLFGAHGERYRKPPLETIAEIRRRLGVSSVQITFHEDRPAEAHAMPPGGFRLAIVNGWDIAACLAARERLALTFWPAQAGERRAS